jgi:hypothetical protein
MTEKSAEQTIQVLGKEGPVTIANLPGAANPVAIIDDTVLDRLVVQCRRAKEEALVEFRSTNGTATLELCATLAEILQQYATLRNKYHTGIGPERDRDAMLRELEATMKTLKSLDR